MKIYEKQHSTYCQPGLNMASSEKNNSLTLRIRYMWPVTCDLKYFLTCLIVKYSIKLQEKRGRQNNKDGIGK
jgi:hypothetical protein